MTASIWWLIHYPDRDPVQVSCCPAVSRGDILEWHPDAEAAEPFTPVITVPDRPMIHGEIEMVRRYCLSEKCQLDEVQNILDQCQHDADAREYFIKKAKEFD